MNESIANQNGRETKDCGPFTEEKSLKEEDIPIEEDSAVRFGKSVSGRVVRLPPKQNVPQIRIPEKKATKVHLNHESYASASKKALETASKKTPGGIRRKLAEMILSWGGRSGRLRYFTLTLFGGGIVTWNLLAGLANYEFIFAMAINSVCFYFLNRGAVLRAHDFGKSSMVGLIPWCWLHCPWVFCAWMFLNDEYLESDVEEFQTGDIYMVLFFLLSIAILVVNLFFICKRGDKNANEYGKPPGMETEWIFPGGSIG